MELLKIVRMDDDADRRRVAVLKSQKRFIQQAQKWPEWKHLLDVDEVIMSELSKGTFYILSLRATNISRASLSITICTMGGLYNPSMTAQTSGSHGALAHDSPSGKSIMSQVKVNAFRYTEHICNCLPPFTSARHVILFTFDLRLRFALKLFLEVRS